MEALKNMPPEPRDPREFVQMDKLYPWLTRKQRNAYLTQQLNIPADNDTPDGILQIELEEMKDDNEAKKGKEEKKETK